MNLQKCLPVWEPKYTDNKIWVSTLKVERGDNYLFFCMDNDYPNLYRFDGDKAIDKAPIVSNGKTYCYALDFSDLEDLGYFPDKLIEKREKQREKYRKQMTR